MTGFITTSPTIGTQPMDIFFDPDTVQRQPLGQSVQANHPYWGQATLVYYRANEALIVGSLVNAQLGGGVRLQPNTTNTGNSCLIALSAMAIGEFGWFLAAGTYVVRSNASLAVDAAIGLQAAGQAGVNAAGRQLLGATVVRASATGLAKVVSAISGSRVLTISNGGDADGWIVGSRLTGTGIGTNATITSISPDGRTVTVDVACTATINNGTVTCTYTNGTVFWNTITFQALVLQGAIT